MPSTDRTQAVMHDSETVHVTQIDCMQSSVMKKIRRQNQKESGKERDRQTDRQTDIETEEENTQTRASDCVRKWRKRKRWKSRGGNTEGERGWDKETEK